MSTDIFDAPPATAPIAPPLTFVSPAAQPLALHEARPIAAAGPGQIQVVDTGVDALIRHALNSGVDIDRLTALYRLKKEWEVDSDSREGLAALAEFKRNAPRIFKDKHVEFKTSKGVTEYDHATLGRVCDVIVGALAEYGITHSWDPKTLGGGRVSVTCIIERGLWKRSVTLEAGFDDSGNKNAIQAQSSAITYLERYTLLAVTGMAVEGMPDDDGRGAQAATNAVAIMTEKILDGLLAQIPSTKTDAAAFSLYTTGAAALKVTKNVEALNEFRQRVAEHRHALAGRAPQ